MLFYLFEDDKRYKYLGEYLLKNNFIKTNNINEADIVILPFIVDTEKFKIDKSFFNNLKKGVKVFIGVKSDSLEDKFKDENISLNTMLEDKSITVLNSIATSEGVLQFIISNTNQTIYNSSFLVLGYGFCGERIVKNLIDLGGNVTVFDRNDFKMRRANLIGASSLNKIDNLNYDVVINTIPTKIIDNKLLSNYPLIIDISSSPFGFDLKYAKENNIDINILRKIPSIFAVKTSGYILGQFIINTLDIE